MSTVRAYGTVAGEFLAFTGTRGGVAGLDAGVIDAFVATLAGYQAKTVEHKLCAVRSLLRFAVGDGLVDAAVLEAVPAAKSTRQARIPSVWDPADVTKVLQAIDRGNPCGKRDYAIILLITRLGLRGVDVKRLRFADLDWPGNRLSVVQAKTGRRVQLPLLKDVGWAIIDYIRHGRPQSDCPEVFLRHTAPIGPFSDQDHLHQILVKHARAAHVPLGEQRRHGMHSLRHTLATRLLEEGTPVEQIADILGHQSVASTGVYLKSSLRLVGQLRPGPGRADVGGATMSAEVTLSDAITALVAEKRAVGYKYDAEARVLARFEAFSRREFPELDTLTEASVQAWIAAARRRDVKPATLQGLVAPVRELARWLGRRGVPAYLLPRAALPRPARYVPHIYTDAELAALFAQTDRCHYCPEVPLRHLVMPVLFRTIYACGLRCSEARLLRVDDVDIDTGVLQIRDAKGGKDRQVPVSEPLRDRLADYHAQVAGQPDRREWFFPGSRPGQPLTLGNVYHNFRRFLWQAGISHGGPGHGPRVHDLRHTFAVNNLRSWFAHGRDVGALLPVLQTYLGHSSIADTAYYLHLTAESYPDITTRVQQVIGDVVPPVTAGPRRWPLTSRCSCAGS